MDDNQPLSLVLRRCATLLTLSEVLSGKKLLQAMWMIEERDQLADRLTFIGIVGVTTEIFGIENEVITSLYIKLNRNLSRPSDELPDDPLPEMLKFRRLEQTDSEQSSVDSFQPPLITGTSSSIFRTHDILSLIGEGLSEKMVFQIGQALGSELKDHHCNSLIMAHDGRMASIHLQQILAKGLLLTGLDLVSLGAAPLPALNFITHHSEGKSGIMITCDHELNEYHGLKMVVAGELLEGEKIQNVKERIDKLNFKVDEKGILENNDTFIEEYIGMICEDIQIKKPMIVVLDSTGVAGEISKKLIQAIGCEVIDIHEDNNSSKISKFSMLSSLVLEHRADIGFSFDHEGVRLRVVDNTGAEIRPDRQMMLFSKHILASCPTSEIIHDTTETSALAKLIKKAGGRSQPWKTGSGFMREKLISSGAKMAGDMHGHLYFNDRWFAFDDALYAACRLLEILSLDERASTDVFTELPESLEQADITIELTEELNRLIIKTLIKKSSYPDGKIANVDGLRIDFFDGWVLVRPGNTEFSLLFHLEAKNEESLDKIKNQLKLFLIQIEPNIIFPF